MAELNQREISDFLARQSVGHVGLIGADGRPVVLPVHYFYENNTVYFATEEGQRLAGLPRHPAICFEVDEYFPELGSYKSVVAYGKARLVEDPAEEQRIVRQLIERYERMGPPWASSKYYPAHALSGRQEMHPLVAIAVTIEEASGREIAGAA